MGTPVPSVAEAAGFVVGDAELTKLFFALTAYMWLDDTDVILATLAGAVSEAIEEGEPLWLMLIGPSSGGKGENLRLVDGVVHKRLKDVTLAGLLTFSQGRGGVPRGLLTDLQNQSALVTITDF